MWQTSRAQCKSATSTFREISSQQRARATTSGRTVRGGPVGTTMSSPSSSPELPRLRFTFTFSEEERDWLLIALENEIKRKQWGIPYRQPKVFERDTARLQLLHERIQKVSLEEMRLNRADYDSK
jgi:hypothetical protein